MAEGSFPKSDGDVLYASEVNNLNKARARFSLNPHAYSTQALAPPYYGYPLTFTSDILRTKTNLTYKNYETESFLGKDWSTMNEYYGKGSASVTAETYDFKTDSTVNSCLVRWDYDVLDAYDECDDSSVSGTYWTTTGTVAENTYGIYATSAGTFKTNDLASYPAIRVPFYAISTSGAAASGPYCSIILEDDSANTTTPIEIHGTGSSNVHESWGELVIYNNSTDDRIHTVINQFIRTNDQREMLLDTATQDTSTWDGKLRVKGSWVAGGGGSGTIKIFNVRKGTLSPSTSMTVSVSADGGSHYETTSNPIKKTGAMKNVLQDTRMV